MGSPESEDDSSRNNSIDPAVGGLVWVRRRNGTWWPGRILGISEVSEGCLVSPRSGTPVKLLGREDASVDWYNIEKSKRVKAFRCGEYDECIEKAKATAAISGKKTVKYARREDAILHALELESASLGKDHPDYWVRPDNSGEDQLSLAGESPVTSRGSKENEDMTDEVIDSEESPDSAPKLSKNQISFEVPNDINGSKELYVQGKRRKTPNDSEDDGVEGIKRMRGLEDLGMGVGSKGKVRVGGAAELIQQGGASFCDTKNGNLYNGSPANGSKGYSTTLKRKRTPVAIVHEFSKRKNRRRPLTKVLESTIMVSVPVVCDQVGTSNGSSLPGLSDGKVSVVEESNESTKSTSVVINNSESTGVSCENGVSLVASEPACDDARVNLKMKETEISEVSGLAGKDRLFDVPLVREDKHGSGISPAFVPCSPGGPEIGVSGRQSSQCNEAEAATLRNDGHNESGSVCSASVNVCNFNQRMEKGTSKWQSKGKRKSRHMSKSRKQATRKYMDMNGEPGTSVAGIHCPDGFLQGADHKVDCNSVRGSKLKSETEKQDWGKLIPHVGSTEVKPLPDESLNPKRSLPFRQTRYTVHSRYQDSPVRNLCVDSVLYDIELEVKASYRRQHVPLVSLMSKLNGKAIIGHSLTIEALNDGYCDGVESDATRVFVVDSGRISVKRKSEAGRISIKHHKLSARYSSSKSLRSRKSDLLSKKIRKLSSLTRQEERNPAMENPKGAVIACIPLKVVFSRINESVDGSARPANPTSTSSNM